MYDLINGNRKTPNGDGSSSKDVFLSSTRMKQMKNKRTTIRDTPREYIAGYIEIMLRQEAAQYGWVLKKDSLDNPIWEKKSIAGGIDTFTGYDEILDEAYRIGFYEEYVVGEEDGRDFLDKAGILEDPYSIFDEELKRKRKRRKQEQQQTNSTHVEGGNQMSKSNMANKNNANGMSCAFFVFFDGSNLVGC